MKMLQQAALTVTKKTFAHKKASLMILGIFVLASSVHSLAYADSGAIAVTAGGAVVLVAFLVGGVEWSLSGFILGIRNHANFEKETPKEKQKDSNGNWLDGWKGFDRKAMKDDVFIGLLLGLTAFLTAQNIGITITNPQSFILAVQLAYGLIAPIDKVVVGGILNQ
jgi:hypothetical protein